MISATALQYAVLGNTSFREAHIWLFWLLVSTFFSEIKIVSQCLVQRIVTSKGILMVDSKKCNSSTIALFYCLSFKKNFEVTMVLGMSDPQFNTYK